LDFERLERPTGGADRGGADGLRKEDCRQPEQLPLDPLAPVRLLPPKDILLRPARPAPRAPVRIVRPARRCGARPAFVCAVDDAPARRVGSGPRVGAAPRVGLAGALRGEAEVLFGPPAHLRPGGNGSCTPRSAGAAPPLSVASRSLSCARLFY